MGGRAFTQQTATDDAKVVWKCSAVSLSTEYWFKLKSAAKLWTLNGLACFYEQIHKQALRVIGHAPYSLLLLTAHSVTSCRGGVAACEERENRFHFFFFFTSLFYRLPFTVSPV